MKVGDLVKRIKPLGGDYKAFPKRAKNDVGIVVGKHWGGDPRHKCIDVFYPNVGKTWSIAESLMEVVSASR